jgi:hypothetical protein
MGKLRQVPLEDLNPMSDEAAYSKGVQVRVATAADGKRSAVIVPRAFARLSPEGMEVVSDLQRESLRLHEIRERVEALVIEARGAGASWAVIGWSVGTTGDSARQRWGELA